jgi:hypothetical protein
MAEPKQLQKQSLECLRLEADCRQMAWDVQSPGLQTHFLRMAKVWVAMAVSGPGTHSSEGTSEAATSTT